MFNHSACIAIIALLLCVLPVTAQSPDQERNDNGHFSWVRQVIPALYGRKPHGYSEIRLLADLARQSGREPVLKALMDSEEFAAHWSQVLIEHLRVNHIGAKSMPECYAPTGNAVAKSDGLAKHIRDETPDELFSDVDRFNMNDVVRSSIVLDDLSPVFLAHLFPFVDKPLNPDANENSESIMQADLLVNFENIYLNRKGTCLNCHNSSFSVTGGVSFWNRAYPIPGHFEEALYGFRTGPDFQQRVSTFLRTDAARPADGETGIKPWGLQGCGVFGKPKTRDVVLDQLPGHRTGKFAAADDSIVSVFDLEKQLRRGFKSLRDRGVLRRKISRADVAYCNMCRACDGLPDEPSFQSPDAQQAHEMRETAALAVLQGKCGNCHGAEGQFPKLTTKELLYSHVIRNASGEQRGCALVSPGDVNQSYIWWKVKEQPAGQHPAPLCRQVRGRMPQKEAAQPAPNFLSQTELETLQAWITGLPENAGCKACTARRLDGCGTPEDPTAVSALEVPPNDGFAFLTMASLADHIWTEVMGQPLTISNYFPRAEGQRNRIRTLTETILVGHKFSLKALLTEILVSSSYFNRTAPSQRTGTGNFDVPLVFDPWVEADKRQPPRAKDGWTPGSGSPPESDPTYDPATNPHNHNNALPAALRRYSAHTMLRATTTALGWCDTATRIGWCLPESLWPQESSADAMRGRDTGLFLSDAEPGFRSVDFQSLLNWEHHVASCRRPLGITRDWIDRLLDRIADVNAADPQRRVTLGEAAAAVKDRLVGDLKIDSGPEARALAVLFGWTVGSGITPVEFLVRTAPIDGAKLRRSLRRYCGVLLATPQFLLGGVAKTALAPPLHNPAALEPRLTVCNDEPCGYHALCSAITPRMLTQKYVVECPAPDAAPPRNTIVRPEDDTQEARIAAARLDATCPPGRCYLLKLPPDCDGDTARCARTLPLCDPGTSSCGGPTDVAGRLKALREGAVLVAELEGAIIVRPGRARLHVAPDLAPKVAIAGKRLKGGEVLTIRLGDTLTFQATPKTTATQGRRRQADAVGQTWKLNAARELVAPRSLTGAVADAPPDGLVVIVTGPTLRAASRPDRTMHDTPRSVIDDLQSHTWRRYGEAGPPIAPSSVTTGSDPAALERRRLRNKEAIERARESQERLQSEHLRRSW